MRLGLPRDAVESVGGQLFTSGVSFVEYNTDA